MLAGFDRQAARAYTPPSTFVAFMFALTRGGGRTKDRLRAGRRLAPLLLLAAAFALAGALLPAGAGTGTEPVTASSHWTDYDTDDNGLIEVDSLAKLDAIRHDLDGDGVATHADYATAFPNRKAAAPNAMGCPASGCTGYELDADLDFDTNDDGSITSADGAISYGAGDAAGDGWTPIGGSTSAATAFSATFDGKGHTISNLFINLTTSTAAGGAFVGLFGETTGHLRNVGIINPKITNTRSGSSDGTDRFGRVGALAGRNNSTSGSISGVYVSGGSVTSADSGNDNNSLAGCLIGYSQAPISDSWTSCDVSFALTGGGAAAGFAGGLVGWTAGSISNSYATGTVTASGSAPSHAGGLMGRLQANITSSYATGNVTSTSTSTSGGTGGLVGFVFSGNIKASFATGNVQSTLAREVGGLVGKASLGNSHVIEACYATGSVARTDTGADTQAEVGGLIGHLTAHQANGADRIAVKACYAIGAVSNAAASGKVGGMVGERDGTNITTPFENSYWNTATTGQSGAGNQVHSGAIAVGRNTMQLQSPTGYTGIYANWNLNIDGDTSTGAMTTGADDPWQFGSSSQYPVLQYQRDAFAVDRQRGGTGGTDYDGNDNNLIDIATLAQLDAIRHDVDGSGEDGLTGSSAGAYAHGFPGLMPGMGCAGTCAGYELTADLDFDTDGDGDVDADDPGSYANWTPISDYAATFDGNGYTISNLTINNAIDNAWVGLFAGLSGADTVVRSLGLLNPNIRASGEEAIVGSLVGQLAGGAAIYAAYVRGGSLTTTNTDVYVGGLVGDMDGANTSIRASYNYRAAITASGAATHAGGLASSMANGANITASYAAASVTNAHTTIVEGGRSAAGIVGAGTISVTNSYWDTTVGPTSSASGGGVGRTTSQLQEPTEYGTQSTDIYRNWNLNLDGETGNDDPWDFGTDSQYPILKYGFSAAPYGLARQRPVDYSGDNTLIDVGSLAQLNAIRYDLNGDGKVGASGLDTYQAAFPGLFGCDPACTGYELTANLDFDTSGDDDVADAPYASWTPIGVNSAGAATAYTGVFEGNRHTISNLRISLSTSTDDGGSYVGLFGDSSGAIRNVGLVNPSISNTRTGGGTFSRTAALVGRNNTGGTIRNSWVDGGTVTVSDSTTTNPLTACLVAYSDGAISDSWTSCAISATSAGSGSSIGNFAGGILAFGARGGSIAGSHATGAVTLSGNTNVNAGGLAGRARANITSSYATGAVTSNSTLAAGQAGGLVGLFSDGDIKASYARGNVSAAGAIRVGGLVGKAELGSSNVIQAAYASGTVSRTATSGGGNVGGLVGQLAANPAGRTNVVQAAYAVGAVSNADTTTPGAAGGLISDLDTVTAPVSASYWNNEASGTNQASSAGGGTGATAANMQTPTGYDSTPVDYSGWNLNLDGAGSGDDPWDFGTNAEYPILQYGHDAISIARQRGISVGGKDYDANDNNLIDIATLDNLNAVRYDLDGDGRNTGADAVGYLAGFPNLTRGMGCPDGCEGYELTAHLDFDTNGDGDVTSADDYESWAHIGNAAANRYDARFVGNGYTIANLTVTSGDGLDALFGGITNDAHITGVGLPGVNITSTGPTVGALVGSNAGLVTASWSSGSVEGTNSVGGLVGYMQADTGQEAVLTASWSSATVNATAGNAGGLVGRVRDTGVVNYSYATGAVTATGGTAGGLLGSVASGGTVRASYWNIETGSMIADDANNDPPEGRTTSQLRAPTGYATLYADWNVDTDGDGNADDPWDFGTSSQYPVLKQGASLAWQGRGGFAYTQNSAAAATLAVTEEAADGAAFGVTLAVAPDADVTVTVTSPGGNDVVTLDGPDASAVFNDSEELTFTAANWDTPQTVTLKVTTGDDNLVDEMSTLTLTAADAGSDKSGYAGLMGSVDVTVNDDDTAAIVLTKNSQPITTLDVTEQAVGGATYDVALSNLPGAEVTVSVTSGTPAKATVSPASLTFTTTNWAMVQTVTVNGLDDADPDDESVTVTHLASGAGSGYEDPDDTGPMTAASQTLTVNVEDNDVPKLRVSETALTITEGATGSFTVRLNSLPTASVTVSITSSNDDVKMREGGSGNYVSPLTLTFNRMGSSRLWSSDQTVNVQAGEDADGDADSSSLTFAISGGDYDDVEHAAISVSVTDDDPKGITLSESNLGVDEGDETSYTVRLATQPSGAVQVSVTTSGSDRAKVSVSSSSGGSFGSSLTLSFNAANYTTPQTVYVRGNADDNTVSETNISIAHAASGGGYGDPDGNGPMTAVSADLPIMLTDTSMPGLRINPTSLAIKEGTEGNYTVRLNTIPDGSVTVSINRDSGPAVTVDDADDGNFADDGSLTFTAGNWNDPQSVKVRAPQVDANETATLSHTASGADYGSVTGDLTVDVRDNLPPIANAGLDQEAYTGQTITLDGSGSTDPDDDDSTLRYAWRQATLVDTRPISLIRANTVRASFAVPTDLSGDTEVEFELTVTDGAGVSDTDTVKAKLLAARPNELVSLTVTAGAGSDAVQRPLTPPFASIQRSFDSYVGAYTTTAQITMTPADPGASVSLNGDNPPAIGARTVRVSLAEGHNRFTIVVSPRPIEAGGQPLQPVTYRLNIRRQRAPRLAFEPERLLLNEGASATYTVALDTRWLGAEVVISITSDNPDVTVAPSSVSISQHDWSARTITVTASDDADGADDFATLRHLANGGQFNNVGGRVWVEVADDDEPTSPEPTPTPTPGQTPTPGPSPTPGPTPTPTPMPTPTPLPGLPKIATTFTTEVPVDGQMVTITREAGSLAGVTLALPSLLTRSLQITIAPLADDIPLSSERFGLGATPAAQSGAALTVSGAPAGGLHLCLPLSDALVSEAGARPLTLVHYEGGSWQSLPGAERRGMSVCAPGVATGLFAAAYALPQLGPASDLTVAAGDTAGTLALRWTPGANATRHWVAGIKQSDWDAGDFSGLIWTAASGADTHTVSGLDSGAEYVFAVAAGRGSEWSAWTALARGTPD